MFEITSRRKPNLFSLFEFAALLSTLVLAVGQPLRRDQDVSRLSEHLKRDIGLSP